MTRGMIGDLLWSGEPIRANLPLKDDHCQERSQEIQPIRVFGTDRSSGIAFPRGPKHRWVKGLGGLKMVSGQRKIASQMTTPR